MYISLEYIITRIRVIPYLRGDIQIAVFRNEKKTDNQPDYDILLSEPKKEDEEIVSSIPQS